MAKTFIYKKNTSSGNWALCSAILCNTLKKEYTMNKVATITNVDAITLRLFSNLQRLFQLRGGSSVMWGDFSSNLERVQ